MTSRAKRRTKRLVSEINVVPYIDVMLVLLIIFMITTPLLTQGVNVNLPQAKAKVLSAQEQTPLIITVDKQGNFYLNISATPSIPMTPQQLSTRVAAELQLAKEKGITKSVYVKGDEYADYGKVVNAMAILQESGADNVGLMTQPTSNLG